MATNDIMRRRLELQAKLNEYEGCDFGCNIGQMTFAHPIATTDFLAIPSNCTSITILHYLTGTYAFQCLFYDASKVYTGNATFNNGQINKTQVLTAGQYAYARICFNLDNIDDCYIKDNTNNQYLWKGKNVT